MKHAERLFAAGEFAAADQAAGEELRRSPEDPTLWRIRIRAPMEQGDSVRGVERYMEWHQLRHQYDNHAIREMAIAVLRRGLVADSPAIRGDSVAAIDRLGLESLAGEVARLIDDSDERVAAAAAIALDHTLPARQRLDRLAGSEDPVVRARVIAALGKLGQRDRARAALADPDSRVRRAAIAGLGRVAGEDVTRLLAMFENDPDGTVRADALAAVPSGRSDALAIARRGLADSYVGTRLAAVALLAELGPSNRETLLQLVGSADYYVALRAAIVLRKAGVVASAEPVELALRDRAWGVRAAALNAVGELVGPERALELAIAAATDERVEVRLAAARVLARFGRTGKASEILDQVIAGPREELRLTAATQLLRIDDDLGRRALARLCQSKNPAIRRAAVLAHRMSDNVTLSLVGIMADEDQSVQIAAAEATLSLL